MYILTCFLNEKWQEWPIPIEKRGCTETAKNMDMLTCFLDAKGQECPIPIEKSLNKF